MTVFWSLAGIMVLVALLFTLPWLLRGSQRAEANLDVINTEVIRDQLAELEADLQSGRLDEDQYRAARGDLERELLADLRGEPADPAVVKERSGRWAGLVLILLIPGLTFALYDYVGTRQIIPALERQATATPEQPDQGAPSIEEMVQRLAERLQQEPDNAEGWVMLARSYTALKRHGDAAAAYAEAHRLVGDHAELLADYADALVMAAGGRFTEQAGGLLLKALESDPENVKALWLAGHWQYQQEKYADAVRYWQRAEQKLPPGGRDAEVIAGQIQQARARLAPGEVIEAPEPVQVVDAGGKTITVTVALDAQLADAAAAEDTVFIFARAVSGPRMPLAIVRKRVSDLPVTVTLDDALAMTPAMKLSAFEQVVVGARVSKSGTAMPQSGDLQGLLEPVAPGSDTAIELTIDSRIP